MTWGRGDQAMCVKRFRGAQVEQEAADRGLTTLPSPPLVYEVVDARTHRATGHVYLGLRPWPRVWFHEEFFRKLEPLPPEEKDRETDTPIVREPEFV